MTHQPSNQSTDSVTLWINAAGRVPLLTAAEELHLGNLVQAWQCHEAGPDGAPASVIRRGRRARDRIVTANLRLVVAIANNCRNAKVRQEDLLQAGAIGLQRAAEKFDPSRGYKFSTYAYWWIKQSCYREIHGIANLIRMPSHIGELPSKIGKATERLRIELGRCPTTAEIAEAVGIRKEELLTLWERSAPVESLDRQLQHGDGGTFADLIPAEQGDPLDSAMAAEEAEALDAALDLLTPEQRAVVLRYHGGSDQLMTVAADLGITRDKAGKLGRQGLNRLRILLRDQLTGQPPTRDDQTGALQMALGLPVAPASEPSLAPGATGFPG